MAISHTAQAPSRLNRILGDPCDRNAKKQKACLLDSLLRAKEYGAGRSLKDRLGQRVEAWGVKCDPLPSLLLFYTL